MSSESEKKPVVEIANRVLATGDGERKNGAVRMTPTIQWRGRSPVDPNPVAVRILMGAEKEIVVLEAPIFGVCDEGRKARIRDLALVLVCECLQAEREQG